MTPIKSPKKLIEVALPLDAINTAATRENYIYKGNPSAIHKWWAQRPLAAARAVIFAQMVNDPGYERKLGRGVNKKKADEERERLFRIIEELVQWENINNEAVLERARAEIRRSWRETCELNKHHPRAAELFDPEKLPAFHDPFAGGGSIPLEAQRLGLEAWASDLNPVAVTINKAMIEIPPKFAGRKPVGPPLPEDRQARMAEDWSGAKGLAEDVRRYGAWMRAEAEKRIGRLYPKITITSEMVRERPDLKPLEGQQLTVIAWLWARTVKSPNPAYSHVEVPLASTFVLSSKEGKEAYVEPVVEGDGYRFIVRVGTPPQSARDGTKLSRGANFKCLLSGKPIEPKHIYAEANAGRMGERLMAIVAEGERGRVYIDPSNEHETTARSATTTWKPELAMPANPRWFSPPLYGLKNYGDLFTPRQLVALITFSDLIGDAIKNPEIDSDYIKAVAIYLAFAISKTSEYSSSLTVWYAKEDRPKGLFARQAIPMVWDFAEQNPLGNIGGTFIKSIEIVADSLASVPSSLFGKALQSDAQNQEISIMKVISTDPPYYDNIGYADLSDFFYVWLRRSIKSILPDLFATLAAPKAEELVATPFRHGSKEQAEAVFLDGMTRAIDNLANHAHPAYPVTIYYAFKQAETKNDGGTSSTGWETFLEAVIKAGFGITGTWPMRTERGNRMTGAGTNALASSIVLVCRKRPADAPTVSRREFLRELNATLPEALLDMTRGGVNSPVAPVDLSQAIIGPGMAIFSQYAAVLEADGTPMRVKTALQLINRFLAEDDFDPDTQFCLHWFEQHDWTTGKFGQADVLARAKGTSVQGLSEAGVVEAGQGQLRLLKWAELPRDWSPETDTRVPIWEALHQLIRALNQDGESAAGALLARMPARAEPIRALAYRLYTLCERQGKADDARAYNELVTAWTAIEQAAWTAIEQAAAESGISGTQAQLNF